MTPTWWQVGGWRDRKRGIPPDKEVENAKLVPMFKDGCNCYGSCKRDVREMKDCLQFIARQRGPITMDVCVCTPGGLTYHDRAGLCFRCEGSGVAP